MKVSECDDVVDRFVSYVNSHERPVKFGDEVTPCVAQPSAEDAELWDWSIRRFEVDWLAEIENRIPRALPPVFRSLVSRYIFPQFDWRGVTLFANTPEKIGFDGHELRIGIFRDAHMFSVLAANGYVQFGQPEGGGYDPVCFSPDRGKQMDGAIVRLDHEAILIHSRIAVVEVISKSAPAFLRAPAA